MIPSRQASHIAAQYVFDAREPLPIAGSNACYPGRVLLAPMSGVTDAPFRNLAYRCGAGAVISEMVASRALCTGQAEMVRKASDAGIRPNVVQLAGREPEWMADATQIVIDAGADVVDINMGCPARRVTSGLSGSALMREPCLAGRLIDATVGVAHRGGIPVTLKMRLGWDENDLNAPDIARIAENCGVGLITVHGRTRCQFYKGAADWRAVKAVVDSVAVPVVVNGDICDAPSARQALAQSGADGVMVGRAAYGRPWLLGALADALIDGRDELNEPPPAERVHIAGEHLGAMLCHYGTELGLRTARKHLTWYLDPLAKMAPWLEPIRHELVRTDDPETVLNELARAAERLSDATSNVAAAA